MKQSALRRLDLCRHSAGVRESCGMSPLPAPVTHSCSAPCHCDAFLCSHQTKFNPSIYSNFCAIDFQEPAFPRLTPGKWHQPSACQPQVLPAPRRTDFLYRSLSTSSDLSVTVLWTVCLTETHTPVSHPTLCLLRAFGFKQHLSQNVRLCYGQST